MISTDCIGSFKSKTAPNMYDNLSETWIKVSPSRCPLQINIYLIVHVYVNNVNKMLLVHVYVNNVNKMLLSKRPHFNHLDVKKKAPSI